MNLINKCYFQLNNFSSFPNAENAANTPNSVYVTIHNPQSYVALNLI